MRLSTRYHAHPLFQSPRAHTIPAAPSAVSTSARSSNPPPSGGTDSLEIGPPPGRYTGWKRGGVGGGTIPAARPVEVSSHGRPSLSPRRAPPRLPSDCPQSGV